MSEETGQEIHNWLDPRSASLYVGGGFWWAIIEAVREAAASQGHRCGWPCSKSGPLP